MRARLQRHRQLALMALLAATVLSSLLLAYQLRFDLAVPPQERRAIPLVAATALLVKMAVFCLGGLHRGWWTWTDTRDLLKLARLNGVASALFALAAVWLTAGGVPRSVYLIDFVLCLGLTAGLRMMARVLKELALADRSGHGRKSVLIYGAGVAGISLARDLRMSPSLKYGVAGFIDDNPVLKGELIGGHRVLGSGRDMIRAVEALRRRGVVVDEAIISMPSATGRQVREAVANCRSAGLPCRILPGLGGLLQGKGLGAQVRNIAVEDLLGREPIRLDKAVISARLKNRIVLLTGAAGSIGSVLCHQIAAFEPARLVLLDQAESGLFAIEMEMRQRHPQVPVAAEIADVRKRAEVEAVFRKHGVNAVYHAAAYKHVPMMELHPLAAVENNVIGTWNLAQAAHTTGVETFVMISSDKAVNPVNVMGATKRAAELVVSSFNELDGRTRFVSVRFGNVLGSSGSVVPIFQKQIAEGGPVTVTHPEVRRYFMLAEEAVQLVLQASTMAQTGEVFVLDMGELVKIADLAAHMIRLAGLEPNVDIEIRYTGLRPGEKLYEEVISEGERIIPTAHDKIKVFRGDAAGRARVEEWLGRVRGAIARRDEVEAVGLLVELAPEYEPGARWRAGLVRKQEEIHQRQ